VTLDWKNWKPVCPECAKALAEYLAGLGRVRPSAEHRQIIEDWHEDEHPVVGL
jgi:hypothetical protein